MGHPRTMGQNGQIYTKMVDFDKGTAKLATIFDSTYVFKTV